MTKYINGYQFNDYGEVLHPYCGRYFSVDRPFPEPFGYWDKDTQEIHKLSVFQIFGGEPGYGPLLSKYNFQLNSWVPVYQSDNPTSFYNGVVYSDKQYINGKWYDKNSPEALALPVNFQRMGLSLKNSDLGCGTMILHGFGYTEPEHSRESIIACFNRELLGFKQGETGIVLVVLNPRQNPIYKDILKEVGFKLLSRHTNYVHRHPNYLYGFRCEDHESKPLEQSRTFS